METIGVFVFGLILGGVVGWLLDSFTTRCLCHDCETRREEWIHQRHGFKKR